ncbi:MAG TPA: 5-deoxy-glucuronate isomerase, partial [Bryobacteraceae bacterium]|nr:5-deoxy-glucuronate isomerase [Bryobacteraceae bacterium]
MQLQIKSPGDAPGVYPLVRRGKELKYLSFTVVELGGSLTEHRFETGPEEISLDFYTGPVEITAAGSFGSWTQQVPARASLQDAHPMVYLPAGSSVRIRALDGSARVTIGGAEGDGSGSPRMISGDEIASKSVGKENWTRVVHTHIADNVPASHLICGETVNRPGGWSSCPPHKHDRFNEPAEVPMEEIYYFQLEPRQGFGFMRVYTDPDAEDAFDLSFAVEHGDTVLIPRGYHPVAACPGYTLNYTWILAGEG